MVVNSRCYCCNKENRKDFYLDDEDRIMNSNNKLAFDHDNIIITGIESLKNVILVEKFLL